jgi:hypothetical protein
MKKLLCPFIALLLLSLYLTGCGLTVLRPEIKEGEFDVSVTYEVKGEIKTLDLVYICEYDGVNLTLEGTTFRAWNGHFDGYEDGALIEISRIDGGKIALCFLIYPEYFMGEPDYAIDFYPHVLTNYIYYEDGVEMINDDQELIAESYGVKIIGCEYDSPIENKFGMFE